MAKVQRRKRRSLQQRLVGVVVGVEEEARPKKNQQSPGLAGGEALGCKYSN